MDIKLAYWGSLILSLLALILIVVNISVSLSNRTLQISVQERQSVIAGGQQLNQINQSLVQALAEAAFKNGNTQIKDLLASQGITLKTDTSKK